MRLTEIENKKKFTRALFTGDAFDKFLVTEAAFDTLTGFRIDGHINMDFLDDSEAALPENQEGVIYWSRVKNFCFEIIKGKKLPLKFKIVFMLPVRLYKAFLARTQVDFKPEDINALFLNISYQEDKLTSTSAVSLKNFSLDKSLENAWDDYISRFIISLQED